MTGRDMVLLISTFIIGVIAGAYFYVSVFATTYEDILQSDVQDSTSFVIEGEMYGACEEDAVCASFQLIEGRTYNYFPYDDAELEQGKLPAAFRGILKNALSKENLEQHAKRSAETNCASNQGGVDYTYTISSQGEDYLLDTCSTLLSDNAELQQILLDVWFALENPDAEAPEVQLPSLKIESISDIFWDRFHSGSQSEE